MKKNRILLSLMVLAYSAIQAQDISPFGTPPLSPRLENSPHNEMSELDLCKAELSNERNQQKIDSGKILLKQFYFGKPLQKAVEKRLGLAGLLKPLTSEQIEESQKTSNAVGAPYNQKVENIVWALYDIASKVHHKHFTEGTFVVEDKGLKLLHYLTSSQDKPDGSYKRISSHFKAYKTQHYGLDLNNLPCNKHTILFGHLNGDRIFIKPENHGTKNIFDNIEHGKEFIIAQARKVEGLRNIFNLASDQDPEFKKERVPDELIQKFSSLLKQLEPDKETQKLHITLAKNYGVQKIFSLLQTYINNFHKLKPILQEQDLELSGSWVAVTQEDVDEMRDLLNATVDFMEELATQDNIALRSGYEVIITQADMKKALGLSTKPQKAEANYQDID